MNTLEALRVVSNIISNEPENRLLTSLSNSEIMGYLLDCGFKDSKKNAATIKKHLRLVASCPTDVF